MSLLSTLKNEVHKAYTQTVSSLTPTLKESKFLTEGVLTPEEVRALPSLPLACAPSPFLHVTFSPFVSYDSTYPE